MNFQEFTTTGHRLVPCPVGKQIHHHSGALFVCPIVCTHKDSDRGLRKFPNIPLSTIPYHGCPAQFHHHSGALFGCPLRNFTTTGAGTGECPGPISPPPGHRIKTLQYFVCSLPFIIIRPFSSILEYRTTHATDDMAAAIQKMGIRGQTPLNFKSRTHH